MHSGGAVDVDSVVAADWCGSVLRMYVLREFFVFVVISVCVCVVLFCVFL